jgi:hypothetical protein
MKSALRRGLNRTKLAAGLTRDVPTQRRANYAAVPSRNVAVVARAALD